MSSSERSEEFRMIEAEFRRIGLDPNDLRGLAISGPLSEFIEYLRSMPAGTTWKQLFPDLPEDMLLGHSESWNGEGEADDSDDEEPVMNPYHDPRDETESRPQVAFHLKEGAFDARELFDAFSQRGEYHDAMLFDATDGEVPGAIRFSWETPSVVVDEMAAWLGSLPFVAKVSASYGRVIPQTDDGIGI